GAPSGHRRAHGLLARQLLLDRLELRLDVLLVDLRLGVALEVDLRRDVDLGGGGAARAARGGGATGAARGGGAARAARGRHVAARRRAAAGHRRRGLLLVLLPARGGAQRGEREREDGCALHGAPPFVENDALSAAIRCSCRSSSRPCATPIRTTSLPLLPSSATSRIRVSSAIRCACSVSSSCVSGSRSEERR